jgi:S1-C subfamily serine protease
VTAPIASLLMFPWLLAAASCAAPRPTAQEVREPSAVTCVSAERSVDGGEGALEASASSVVLIVADLDNGATRYGAGVVTDASGSVITSWHLLPGARSLWAMLYRRGRPSYTPMEGGLGRFLTENRAALLEADPLRGDPVLDIALLHVHADTSGIPKLTIARDPPRVGDRVFALGHPNESVWSLTAGVVSSVRGGLIQHDAAIGTGSSGGPLLDARGRIVGINTSKLFEPAEGIGFARPVGLLDRFSGNSH